jgi:hypothetical protein
MPSGEKTPVEVDLSPNQIGAVGEAIFATMYEPPDPAPNLVRDFCHSIAPKWVDVDDLTISSMGDNRRYVVETEKSTLKWKSDALVTATYHPKGEEHEQLLEELDVFPVEWQYRFPIEIKTGNRAEMERNQRAVMENLSSWSEIQPILIRLGIESLPESFTVEEVEFVKPS